MHRNMTHLQNFFNSIDLVGQLLLLFAAVAMAILTLVTWGEAATTIFYFLLLLVIGGWQMLSAFIRGIGYGDRIKTTYFFSALTYCVLLCIFVPLIDKPSNAWALPLVLWLMGVVPVVSAVWYFRDCITPERHHTKTQSHLVPDPSVVPLTREKLKKFT